jgi:8-amino-7-oxononanoate synthase
VRRAAAAAIRDHGMGPRGAALVCGHTTEHAALERDLAALVGAEATLLFPTGFSANLAVLSSLAGPGTVVFSDALNHASIIDGSRLARQRGADVVVYRHADARDLEARLRTTAAPRKLVVTDAVFSMDGDLAPLPEIVAAAREHEALIVVDEAHALLVLGDGGGVARNAGVGELVDVRVGTLGKAIGSHGGFVATSARLRDHLLNHGRSFIYSTALPLPAVAAARAALATFRSERELSKRLRRHRETLGRRLDRELASAIVPIVLGEEARVLAAGDALLEAGFLVPGIRPPTVPPGTSRLRVTLSAGHTTAEVEALANALDALEP